MDAVSFHHRTDGPMLLSLAVRAWKVTHLDWGRKSAYTELVRWWTFAGDRYNAAAAERLLELGYLVSYDGLAVSVSGANLVTLDDDVARVVAGLVESAWSRSPMARLRRSNSLNPCR